MAGAMFKRIDGENCSMNKIVHFIGFDGDGFSAAVKVWGAQILFTSFSIKEALGISTSTTIQLFLGERLSLLLTLSGLTKTTTDIERGAV